MAQTYPQDMSPTGVYVAPMAGGPSTPELVIAAGLAGAAGFIAGGYKSAPALAAELSRVAAAGPAPFGVNLFVPVASTTDDRQLARYLDELRAESAALGTACGDPVWDDDAYAAKLEVILSSPPPIVSFTFGCPAVHVVQELRRAGSQVWVTVTSPDEARLAADTGTGALCVQGPEAGAHRGRFDDRDDGGYDLGLLELLDAVAATVDLPLVAAGGIMSFEDARVARSHGAVGVQCGTAFLRCAESGANPLHKAALVDERFVETRVTRAFSGRRARGLLNAFMSAHPDAPSAYPQINNATRPLRAAAGAVGDVDRLSLWAGTGFRRATVGSVAEIVEQIGG